MLGRAKAAVRATFTLPIEQVHSKYTVLRYDTSSSAYCIISQNCVLASRIAVCEIWVSFRFMSISG